jgi:hypothetical protein
LKPNFGFINITSNPSEVNVFLNNKPVGKTPYRNKVGLEKGTYRLKLEKELFYGIIQDIDVYLDSTANYNFELDPAFGQLVIKSYPEGADLLIDGQKVGTTPYLSTSLASGIYQIGLKKELYREVNKSITIEDGKIVEESIILPPNFGIVMLKSIPGAKIYLDGKLINQNLNTLQLRAGYHELKAEFAKHNPATASVNITVGEEKTIQLMPEPRKGRFAVFAEPTAARDAEVYIDGTKKGNAPLIIKDLLEGSYLLELRKTGYLTHKEMITIEYNKEKDKTIKLITYEGSLQAEKDFWNRYRNWTLVGTIVFAGAGAGLKYLSSEGYKDYENAGSSEEATKARDEIEKYDTLASAAFVGAGIFGLWTVYNQIRKSTVKSSNRSLSLDYNPLSKRICLKIWF